jgi:hypothetical protein
MKKNYIILLSGIAVLIFTAASVLSPTGKAGATGSPGETTCNTSGCHNSFALNSGPGSITVTSDIPNWEYTPGQLYTINVKVKHAGRSLFGFGTEILKADGSNSGNMAIINSAKTQFLNIVVGGKTRRNATHKSNGGAAADSMEFSIHWTAPLAGTGDATIYFAGNACNNNSEATGDFVYSGSQVIAEAITSTGVDRNAMEAFTIYPNPVKDKLNIEYNLKANTNVVIKIYSLDGKLIRELINESQSGAQKLSFDLKNELPKGAYIISAVGGNVSLSRKIFVQ